MRVRQFFFFGLVATALVGCGGSVTSNGIANIRGINASSSPALVDLFTDFNLIGFSIPSGQASQYSLQQAQLLTIGVRQTGTTTTIGSANFQPDPKTNYSVVFYPTGASAWSFLFLQDSVTAPAATKFKLRLINTNLGGGTVDVYFTDPDTDLTLETPVFDNIPFTGVTASIDLAAGIAKQIRITPGNSTTPIVPAINLTGVSGATHSLLLWNSAGPKATLLTDN
ncbi:MAG: DUF4397 domain-containing protein [Fimbriimonadaceae bacterium]|nr:DUF4397 domain-containing protein [Fimbriimonadaceae bacterium]